MAEQGVIPENSAGPDHGLTDVRPVSKPKGGRAWWDSLTDEQKAEHTRKTKEAAAKAREQKAGRRGGDSRPKSKARQADPAIDTKASDLALIRGLLATVLTAPSAIGAATGDPWMTQHFITQGPALADAIVEEAARNDAFRAYLVRLAKAARGVSIIGALAMYLAPPLMHYGIVPGAQMLGVPVKDAPPGQASPRPGQAPPFIAPERGPATAPGGPLDGEALRAWAEAEDMGGEGFAEELADLQDGGGFAPPLPMEAV